MYCTPTLRFVKDIIKREVVSTKTGEVFQDIEIVIKLKNITNNKSRIHKTTDFLTHYRNNKPKYVSDIADNLVLFLNHIYFELNATELKNIEYLTFDIGANFLENYSVGKSKNTVLRMERTLTKFYFFLASKNILYFIHQTDFTLAENKNKPIIHSPFTGLYKQFTSESNKPIHNLDPKLVYLFLDKAEETCPRILLGVYMQFFGGLRISEIISLQYSNLSIKGVNGQNGMIANIKSQTLRPDLKSSLIHQAKKSRRQVIIGIPALIQHIYLHHIQNYKSPISNAIFTNTNGKAMTSDMYRYYFNKAKHAFINTLISSNDIILKSNGLFLQNQKWGTHIGRGIFSNMVAEYADNITEIAAWRGDSNLDSSLSYITDTKKIEQQIITVMNNLYLHHLSK